MVGGRRAACFSWRSLSWSAARPSLRYFATHILPALSDMWHRPGTWGYCAQMLRRGPPARGAGVAGEAPATPDNPMGAQVRWLSALQPPQRTLGGGGLGAQCSSRLPQERHR